MITRLEDALHARLLGRLAATTARRGGLAEQIALLVVFAGVPLSVKPLLTAYRGLELTAAVVVVLCALCTRSDAVRRLETVLFWFVASWTGLLLYLDPGRILFILMLTVLMCTASGSIAVRRILTADPAEVFR